MADEIRYITSDTPPLDKFRIGDEVAHVRAGDGMVTAHEDGCVVVTYKLRFAKNKKPLVGKYDANWFRINPRLLFHRGDITPTAIAAQQNL